MAIFFCIPFVICILMNIKSYPYMCLRTHAKAEVAGKDMDPCKSCSLSIFHYKVLKIPYDQKPTTSSQHKYQTSSPNFSSHSNYQ
ncbi:hypothetical protein RIF29_26489 [Crotalaria pallida]|uniref:Uncharacterized protein n=1 Tax=Crotalaria pallida TaxID=3830 RepID=A0AAN9ENR8_CROPI